MDSGTWWPLIGGRSKRTNTLGPVAQGGIADISLPQGLGATIVDIVSDFSGGDLTYSLAPSSDALPAGLQFNQNGTITGTPTDLTPGRFIVIRASNTFGFADSGFVLEVVALSFTPELTGLTNNSTHGLSAQTGTQLTANAVDFNGPPPNAVTYQWETAESGPIPGATNANYTPDASANDGESLFCRIEADFYPTQVSDSFVIRQVPPTAQGALFDDILDLGSGPELYDVASDFTGVGLEYSVAGPGTSIDAQTGLLTIQTNSPVVGAVVAVTATNSGGTAQSAFLLTVEDAGIGPGPDISNPVLDSIQDTIAFSLEFAGTVYWRRDATGTNPDAAAVIAGGGFDSGSFSVSEGQNAIDVTFAQGNDGLQEISFVAAANVNEPSLVQTVAIEIDTTEPMVASTSPLAGGNTSQNVQPTLSLSEPVVAGSGTFTLYDVTANQALEVFDVNTDAGTGAGQIEVAGNQVILHPSSPLPVDKAYAVLADQGALTDLSGNEFAGISSMSAFAFSTAVNAGIDTDFGADFTSAEPDIWTSMQNNMFNAVAEHRGTEPWSGYPSGVTTGGVVGVKSGNYPQIRFSVAVEVGKTYEIDADFPIGEGGWFGPLRVKLGSAIGESDYAQIDETESGQPSVVELRGQSITATTDSLWFAVIVETAVSGAGGGNPAISLLRVTEV